MQSLVLTSTELEKSSSFITVDEGKNVKQLRILSFNSIFFIFTGIKRQDSLVTWSSYSLFISKYSYPSSSRKSSGEENLSSSSNSHRFCYWAACAPSHKMGFRSSAAKNGLPGEGRHEGLVPRNDVLTNGFI